MAEETDWQRRKRTKPSNWHLIFFPALAVLAGCFMYQFWYFTPYNVVRAHEDAGWTTEEAQKKQSGYGDTFGAANALFSGFAMVAAVTAIFIQIFEFSAQRDELHQANIIHDDRLTFDKTVHDYDRRVQMIIYVNRFEKPGIQTVIDKVVHENMFKGFDPMIVIDAIFMKEAYQTLTSKMSHTEIAQFDAAIKEASTIERITRFMNELSIFKPTDDELEYWRQSFEQLQNYLWLFIKSARNTDRVVAPIWVKGATEILERIDSNAPHIKI